LAPARPERLPDFGQAAGKPGLIDMSVDQRHPTNHVAIEARVLYGPYRRKP
jgi:hypothetical protein